MKLVKYVVAIYTFSLLVSCSDDTDTDFYFTAFVNGKQTTMFFSEAQKMTLRPDTSDRSVQVLFINGSTADTKKAFQLCIETATIDTGKYFINTISSKATLVSASLKTDTLMYNTGYNSDTLQHGYIVINDISNVAVKGTFECKASLTANPLSVVTITRGKFCAKITSK